jgi:hypothetical protein
MSHCRPHSWHDGESYGHRQSLKAVHRARTWTHRGQRRQPDPQRRARLAARRSDHRQPGQKDIEVSLFDLLTIGAILGGEPQRPPFVPEERPLVAQLADLVLLDRREVHGVASTGPAVSRRQVRSGIGQPPAVVLFGDHVVEPDCRRTQWLFPAHGGSRGVHRWSGREADASAGRRLRAQWSSGLVLTGHIRRANRYGQHFPAGLGLEDGRLSPGRTVTVAPWTRLGHDD